MKHLLLGTTALVAAGVLAAGPVSAQQAKAPAPITITTGGYFEATFGFVDQNDGAGQPGAGVRNHQVFREAEIWFNGRTQLDNGLVVGLRVELEAESCQDIIDQSFLFFDSGTFGRIEAGTTDGVGIKMAYGYTTPFAGGDTYFVQANRRYSVGANLAGGAMVARTGIGDFEKVNYYTPRIFGFQIGASYAPDGCEETDAAAAVAGSATCGGSASGPEPQNNSGQQSEIWEAAINYVGRFGDVGFAAYASTVQGSVELPGAGAGAVGVGFNNEDRELYGVGAQVTFAGFTVAAMHKWDSAGIDAGGPTFGSAVGTRLGEEIRVLGVSAMYDFAPFQVSVEYARATVDAVTVTALAGAGGTVGSGEDEHTRLAFGGSYLLGPGIKTFVGLEFFDLESGIGAAAGTNDGWGIFGGTMLTF